MICYICKKEIRTMEEDWGGFFGEPEKTHHSECYKFSDLKWFRGKTAKAARSIKARTIGCVCKDPTKGKHYSICFRK